MLAQPAGGENACQEFVESWSIDFYATGISKLSEEPLEKETATHFSIFAWEIPWTEEPGRLQVHGVPESDMT